MDGRHVSIALLQSQTVTPDIFALMKMHLTLTGSPLPARPVADKAAIAAQLREIVWPRLEEGSIRPLVYRTFPLAEAAASHALMESSTHTGKIALLVRKKAG